MEQFFGNRKITLYSSGTAALAQAIANCASRSSTATPEVILPAYGCPDLVAACVHASVYPRLVDVAPSHWSYDLEALESSLSSNTVAIVAVNLLGLGDGSTELMHLCKERHIALIQDSAQFLPRKSIAWPGDYVVLSFGRGKPLNLLQGGALISPMDGSDSLSVPPAHYSAKAHLLSTRAAAVAFNALTHPALYRVLSALPGTSLAEVIYKSLTNPAPLPDSAWRRVAIAFELYREKSSYSRKLWTSAIEDWGGLGVVALTGSGSSIPAEPLRLALLAPDRAARDTLVDEFIRAGLGASRFYRSDLTGVTGIPEVVKRQGPFPNASSLADRLFTLPTHSLVNTSTVRRTHNLVVRWRRSHA